MASMSTDSRRRFFRAKGEISRMRAHEWPKIPLAHSIKTNQKLTSASYAAARV